MILAAYFWCLTLLSGRTCSLKFWWVKSTQLLLDAHSLKPATCWSKRASKARWKIRLGEPLAWTRSLRGTAYPPTAGCLKFLVLTRSISLCQRFLTLAISSASCCQNRLCLRVQPKLISAPPHKGSERGHPSVWPYLAILVAQRLRWRNAAIANAFRVSDCPRVSWWISAIPSFVESSSPSMQGKRQIQKSTSLDWYREVWRIDAGFLEIGTRRSVIFRWEEFASTFGVDKMHIDLDGLSKPN